MLKHFSARRVVVPEPQTLARSPSGVESEPDQEISQRLLEVRRKLAGLPCRLEDVEDLFEPRRGLGQRLREARIGAERIEMRVQAKEIVLERAGLDQPGRHLQCQVDFPVTGEDGLRGRLRIGEDERGRAARTAEDG